MAGGFDVSRRQALHAKFQAIAAERLERCNEAFLKLEQDPGDEGMVTLLLREMHTLKGEAKLLGFSDVNFVAHRTEDLLLHAKGMAFHMPPELVDQIFRAFDLISVLLNKQVGSDSPTVDLVQFGAEVERTVEGKQAAPERGEAPATAGQDSGRATDVAPATSGESTAMRPATRPTGQPWDEPATRAVRPPSPAEQAASPSEPTAVAGAPAEQGSVSPPESTAVAAPFPEQEQTPAPPAASSAAGARPAAAHGRASYIRVGTHKIDTLTELMGDATRVHGLLGGSMVELARMEQELRRIAQRLTLTAAESQSGEPQGGQGRMAATVAELQALANRAGTLIQSSRNETLECGETLERLERAVREMRMLPISTLLGQYGRAVRDIAREQGKRVRFGVNGGELELDKNVLDRISDPLLHIVRNAVDHGIESPEERTAGGKWQDGIVTIQARQVGAQVEISVIDDGRGLDLAAVRRTAVVRGLATPEDVETLSRSALLQLLFLPGFSTRTEVTDTSGRGVGLDVVKESVESMGGTVALDSWPGGGSRLTLSVPTSVAMQRALVVQVADRLFALPSLIVNTVVEVATDSMELVGQGLSFRNEGALIPFYDLGLLLWEAEERRLPQSFYRVLVVEVSGQRMGFHVDRVVGERDLVVRPLDPFIADLAIYTGAAVLEHDQPVLMLNMPEVARRSHTTLEALPSRPGAQVGHILLVEDSELTRDMLSGLIRAEGHRVTEAANGRDALRRMERELPDLVMTDLEMPVMDGFELIQAIRSGGSTQHVPIIVLSSRGSEEDKRHAAELGADAYMVKVNFREETLRATLQRFLAPARPEQER